jgi:KamA family protein
LGARAGWSPGQIERLQAIALVLPFKLNNYLVDELVDWSHPESDPILRMTMPAIDSLPDSDIDSLVKVLREGEPDYVVQGHIRRIRASLNPHPAGQLTLNVPQIEDERIEGIQHKYAETVLIFPRRGQTCHAFCNFCFRWPQFTRDGNQIAVRDESTVWSYLKEHTEVQCVLITGGDPLVMRVEALSAILDRLLEPSLGHITSIRIGTRAFSHWPYRFTTDHDSAELLSSFEKYMDAGKSLTLVAHFVHPRELETRAAVSALRAVRKTGATLLGQGPILRGVNDDSSILRRLWLRQVENGVTPYYTFVERNTGAFRSFRLPLVRYLEVFQTAYESVQGACRTVRGPVMSTVAGKVQVQSITTVEGRDAMELRYIQARNPAWLKTPFFTCVDHDAAWIDELVALRPSDALLLEPNTGRRI